MESPSTSEPTKEASDSMCNVGDTKGPAESDLSDSGWNKLSSLTEHEASPVTETGPENDSGWYEASPVTDTGPENDATTDTNVEESESVSKGIPSVTEEIYMEQEEFLRAIHSRFLDLVQPIQSGLTDELRSVGAIDGDEEEDVKSESTTRDKARRLWYILHRVPPKLFGEKCMPILQKLYRHMLEGAEYRWDGQPDLASKCLRHAVMTRIPVKRFADVFPSTRCCNAQEYRNILESKGIGEDQWEPVFCLLKKNSSNEDLIEKIRKVLHDIGFSPLYNVTRLKRQLWKGLPCTCRVKSQNKPRSKFLSTVTDVDNASSVTSYPNKSGSSEGARGRSDSVSSIPSSEKPEDAALTVKTEHQPEPFRTKQEKDTYANILKTFNKALADVCRIKMCCRELEGVGDQLAMMTHTTADTCLQKPPIQDGQDESVDDDTATQHRSLKDYTEYVMLEGRAQNIRSEAGPLFHRIKSVLLETIELCKDTPNFPTSCVSTLLTKRHLLEREVNEAEYFFKRLQTLFDEITSRCTDQIKRMRLQQRRLKMASREIHYPYHYRDKYYPYHYIPVVSGRPVLHSDSHEGHNRSLRYNEGHKTSQWVSPINSIPDVFFSVANYSDSDDSSDQ